MQHIATLVRIQFVHVSIWKPNEQVGQYLSCSFRAGNVGMKSFVLGKGTSRNHSWFKASSADMRCAKGTRTLSCMQNEHRKVR
jgi:hypothetical protein